MSLRTFEHGTGTECNGYKLLLYETKRTTGNLRMREESDKIDVTHDAQNRDGKDIARQRAIRSVNQNEERPKLYNIYNIQIQCGLVHRNSNLDYALEDTPSDEKRYKQKRKKRENHA